jgi:hypothetical protein
LDFPFLKSSISTGIQRRDDEARVFFRNHVGETGVKRDTGSKGTVGGKIVDVNKTVKIFSMLCKSV